jgi:glucokinase
MLLAGDVGATKTLLCLVRPSAGRPELVDVRSFPTLDYADLGEMITAYLEAVRPSEPPVAAAFGVAGPVKDAVARLTNVPWDVDGAEVSRRFSLRFARVLNDLEAMACAVPLLAGDELVVLQPGRVVPTGNAALIAAGTGLGEALLHNVKGRFVPSPSEGGHADFAPRTVREIELLRALTAWYGRASYEHVLSGPGLVNIHRFVHGGSCPSCDLSADPAEAPSLISRAALARTCDACVATLDLFVSAYGAEAGNHALRSVATAGLFVGGGIAPKILPALQTGLFMDAFRMKAPLDDLVSSVPVSVIMNEQAALVGAAVHVGNEAH